MYYLIRSLEPTDGMMGGHGFCIDLHDNWRDLVAKCGLDQSKIDMLIRNCARGWLDCCGYDRIFDPDNCGAWADKNKRPGPDARPAYDHRSIRVAWGEWGPEHITVPGNACGLDIERHGFGTFTGGAQLTPHNIDCWAQKQLLLIVFCRIAEDVVLFADVRTAPTLRG